MELTSQDREVLACVRERKGQRISTRAIKPWGLENGIQDAHRSLRKLYEMGYLDRRKITEEEMARLGYPADTVFYFVPVEEKFNPIADSDRVPRSVVAKTKEIVNRVKIKDGECHWRKNRYCVCPRLVREFVQRNGYERPQSCSKDRESRKACADFKQEMPEEPSINKTEQKGLF